ncbi:Holliday junction resolvase RecU [Lactiplantibacillus fabifermentans]|uniref:Holliday junction resolvase RecU n=2 Tax=Lactiplantibacillus fabifermentans TaxID=483011 RepID=A0A0R2NNS1_9LACO|nr:Holliday junction resolvase RecU [Lactiplantibacillus fabifermentans]ETY74309.1 recombinase RecU [Lactiplantibacillus fabifermentans T30PCM01]KRO27393.1 holliday junction resolvase recu [Lactiplantibacillus fabifermentans DSM 21115]
MTIRYPNGKAYRQPTHHNTSPSKFANVNFGDRGMSLEEELNDSNTFYLENDIAVIHKKPTPIQIVKVDYPSRSAAVIKEAYFKQASTTDYNGVYRGKYLDFEAKETKSKTAFPLKNFHEHQIEHMRKCMAQAGICFVIIRFAVLDRLFLLKASDLFTYWDRQTSGGRKSIPLTDIEKLAAELHYQINPLIPYLDAVDQIIG